MNDSWSFDDPIYDAIRSYVTTDWSYDSDHTIYILDNMLLTRLARLARERSNEFSEMTEFFSKEKAIFFIPNIIFEESAQLAYTTSERYAAWYSDFFKQLSTRCKIVRISFRSMFDMMTEGSTNLEIGWTHFKLIATETVRMNPDLLERVTAATNLKGIEEAIHSIRADCGERVIHLLVCSFLSNGAPYVTTLSNEEKGVFNVRYMLAKNERLLELLYIEDMYVFFDSYRLFSYDRLLYHLLKGHKMIDLASYLDRVRDSKDQTRYVRIVYGNESDRRQLNHTQFADIIVDTHAKITF